MGNRKTTFVNEFLAKFQDGLKRDLTRTYIVFKNCLSSVISH